MEDLLNLITENTLYLITIIVVILLIIFFTRKRECPESYNGKHNWEIIPDTTKERSGSFFIQTRKEICTQCKKKSNLELRVNTIKDTL